VVVRWELSAVFRILAATILVAVCCGSTTLLAQELTPRAYWPAPKGTQVLVLGYQYSSGDVATDPTLPLENVDSRNNYAQVTYQRTFDLFGRTANFQLNAPYAWGKTEGFVEGVYRNREISGLADARMLLAVNLLGAPSMDRQGFQALRANPRPIVGASLLLQVPTGDWDPDKVINAGSNRYAAKLELGAIWPLRPRWLLEAELGAWFFGDNDEFLGVTRQQDPILSAQAHLIRRIRPGFWLSLDANYYQGGETTVDGQHHQDGQRNSRAGATLVIPFHRTHAIRLNFSTALATRNGGEFNTWSLNYLLAF